MQITPADEVLKVIGVPRSTATAATVQPAELLDIDRHQLARLAHVESAKTARRLRKQMRETVRAVPSKDAMHGAGVHPEHARDAVRSPVLLHPQRQDGALERIGRSCWRMPRAAGPVVQIRSATEPAVHRAPADAHVPSDRSDADAPRLSDQKLTRPRRGASGTVHRSPPTLVLASNTSTLVGGFFCYLGLGRPQLAPAPSNRQSRLGRRGESIASEPLGWTKQCKRWPDLEPGRPARPARARRPEPPLPDPG